MAKMLISYDLNNPGRDYMRITDRIKELGAAGWCKPLESLWIILTDLTPLQVCQDLEGHCDASSKIFVADVTRSDMAWTDTIPEEVSDWLRS